MADYAYSHVLTQTEGVVMQRIGTFCSAGYQDASGKAIVSADGSIPCTANPYGGKSWAYMPDQVNYSQVEYDRVRKGTALAFQYENNDGTVRFKAQYNDSKYKNAWLERSVNVVDVRPVGRAGLLAADHGLHRPGPGLAGLHLRPRRHADLGHPDPADRRLGRQHGRQHQPRFGRAGLPFVNYCGGVPACASQREGLYIENQARNFDHSEGTKDFSANLQWDVSDRLHTSFDVQYIKADTNNYDILVANRTMADAQYKVNGNGTPQITLQPGSNVNYAPGFLSNPHNYWIPFIQDHYEDNDAKELALRADGEYEFADGGWLNSLKVGVRYADRKQKVRYSTYNWSPVAAPWNCNGPGFNVDNTTPTPYPATDGPPAPRPARQDTFQGYGAGIWSVAGLGDFYDGKVFPNNDLVFLSKATLADHDGLIKALSGKTTNSPMLWTPLCERTTNTEGCFIDPEMVDVEEKTKAPTACCASAATTRRSSTASPSRAMSACATCRPRPPARAASRSRPTPGTRPAGHAVQRAAAGQNSVTNISCWLTDRCSLQQRRRRGQRLQRQVRQLAAQLQRPVRPERQELRPLRRLAGLVAAGLRPAAQLRRHPDPGHQHLAGLALRDLDRPERPARGGQRQGL
jgi:hypothetical protein